MANIRVFGEIGFQFMPATRLIVDFFAGGANGKKSLQDLFLGLELVEPDRGRLQIGSAFRGQVFKMLSMSFVLLFGTLALPPFCGFS